MKFYLGKILACYVERDQTRIDAMLQAWEASAPRAFQRQEALRLADDADEPLNLILYGKLSGTGKTTVAYEHILRSLMSSSGAVCEPLEAWPIALSGHDFARQIAGKALKLDTIMQDFIGADTLLLDDLDKRGKSDSKFSPIVQQSLFDVIEARTTQGRTTIITCNASGSELEAKFDDDIAPYLMRRLRERFRAIDFDPQVPALAVMEAAQ